MKLLARNLARSTTEDELRKMFEALGKVQSCSLVIDKKTGNSEGFAFIEMPRPGEAKAAVKTLNGTNLAGSIIRVKKAVLKKTEPENLATQNIAVGEVKTGEVKAGEVDQEKTEPEKLKAEKVEAKKNDDVNRNIWSK